MGVGTLVVVDPDGFDEHNLNRQLFSSPANLGRAKVEAAALRVSEINPAVTLVPLQVALSSGNGVELVGGCRVAVDALDSIRVRLELADVCTELNVPLVHGAIAGWYGHVATQFPGDNTLQTIYAGAQSGKGMSRLSATRPLHLQLLPALKFRRSANCCWDRGRCYGDAN